MLFRSTEEDDLDGIALLPLKMNSIEAFVKRMEEKNVPMVFFNLDMEGTLRLSYVGCDYYASGRVAAGLTALAVRERGKIAVSTNFDQISPSFRQRLEGFLGELDREYPDIQIVNRDFDFVFQQGDYENILEIVRKNPDLEALYVVNPGDYSICEKISELDKEKKIKIITNDIIQKQKSLMDRGIIVATIGQQPEKQGALPLQILYDYIGLGIVPKEKYLTELSIRIKQNI